MPIFDTWSIYSKLEASSAEIVLVACPERLGLNAHQNIVVALPTIRGTRSSLLRGVNRPLPPREASAPVVIENLEVPVLYERVRYRITEAGLWVELLL